jgi:hypothetical protein
VCGLCVPQLHDLLNHADRTTQSETICLVIQSTKLSHRTEHSSIIIQHQDSEHSAYHIAVETAEAGPGCGLHLILHIKMPPAHAAQLTVSSTSGVLQLPVNIKTTNTPTLVSTKEWVAPSMVEFNFYDRNVVTAAEGSSTLYNRTACAHRRCRNELTMLCSAPTPEMPCSSRR